MKRVAVALSIIVAGPPDMPAIRHLAYDVYLAEGYCDPNDDGMLRHYEQFDDIRETTVVAVAEGNRIVGTDTITLDGPAGLPMDVDFRADVDKVRGGVERLAGLWRFATDPSCRRKSRVVIKLMGGVRAMADWLDVDTALTVVHPKHEAYFRRFGFRTISEGRCEEVGGQPALLLRMDAA